MIGDAKSSKRKTSDNLEGAGKRAKTGPQQAPAAPRVQHAVPLAPLAIHRPPIEPVASPDGRFSLLRADSGGWQFFFHDEHGAASAPSALEKREGDVLGVLLSYAGVGVPIPLIKARTGYGAGIVASALDALRETLPGVVASNECRVPLDAAAFGRVAASVAPEPVDPGDVLRVFLEDQAVRLRADLAVYCPPQVRERKGHSS